MNKEILETTIKFHDTYERLSKEFNYTTREDTREFDINSNNGKLMYATVNEVVSPLLDYINELESNRDIAIKFINNNMYERYCYGGCEDILKEILRGSK